MTHERWRLNQSPWAFRPTREMEEMRRKFEDDIVRPAMRAIWERIPEEVKGWSPAVDIYERGDFIEIKVDIPGVKQEDVEVSLANDTLMIKGERKGESGVKDEDYTRREIAFGSFYRTVALPPNIDIKTVDASYEDGMLRIKLQRAAGTKRKKVNIEFKKSGA